MIRGCVSFPGELRIKGMTQRLFVLEETSRTQNLMTLRSFQLCHGFLVPDKEWVQKSWNIEISQLGGYPMKISVVSIQCFYFFQAVFMLLLSKQTLFQLFLILSKKRLVGQLFLIYYIYSHVPSRCPSFYQIRKNYPLTSSIMAFHAF